MYGRRGPEKETQSVSLGILKEGTEDIDLIKKTETLSCRALNKEGGFKLMTLNGGAFPLEKKRQGVKKSL